MEGAPRTRKLVAILPLGKWFEQSFSESIRPLCEARDITCQKLEPEFSSQSRLGQICAAIESADLVLADIGTRNPNVLYLTGYSHGVGKRVLLIAGHGEDLPFDRTRHDIIIYNGDLAFLRSELGSYLERGSVTPEPQSTQAVAEADDARTRFESIFGDILRAHNHRHRGAIEMENATTFVLLDQDMDLALVQALARHARELGLRLKLM